jgi:hypothetical protein
VPVSRPLKATNDPISVTDRRLGRDGIILVPFSFCDPLHGGVILIFVIFYMMVRRTTSYRTAY